MGWHCHLKRGPAWSASNKLYAACAAALPFLPGPARHRRPQFLAYEQSRHSAHCSVQTPGFFALVEALTFWWLRAAGRAWSHQKGLLPRQEAAVLAVGKFTG